MEKKIVQVYFTPGSTYPGDSPSVWQYDYGQILRIQGLNLPPAVEIHFALQKTGGTSKTRIGITKDGVTDVPIPDSMLENEDTTQDYSIYAFIYLTDETSGQTEYRITLRVKARPKPEVPGGGDNPDIFHEAVEAVREAMKAAAESEKQAEGWAHGREDLPERAEDNAKYYAGKAHEDAEQTATDKKEVERLVESVSGIEEQVEKVDELTKQAQKAAADAGLYKEAAENARKGAETAKSEAETAAGKTAEDKTAVETARGEVLKAQEAVSTDRKAVESIKTGIEQLGGEITGAVEQGMQELGAAKQQAVQAIEQTGTAQKSAVEASGAKALQSIENIKQTAEEAVEAAKSEAVQAIQAEGITQTGNVTTEGTKQVQAVADKGKEVLQSFPPDFPTQIVSKLDKNQGVENAGKVLTVGEDGNVIPGEVQGPGGTVELDTTLTQPGKAADAKATGDKILQFAIKNTVNGESPLVVPDSAEEGILGLKVFGKSTQVQTTGAQLFNAREALASQIEKGIVSFDSDGKIILNGKFDADNRQFNITLQPGTYTLSGDDNGIWHIIAKNDSVFRQTLVVDVETTYQCYIASNTYSNRVTAPMINIGDSAKSYEPYTGGKPSPSPECPQEIVTSGKLNEDTGKYEVGIKVTGKNLIPFPYPLLGGIGAKGTKNGVSWEILKDRGIKFTGKATGDVYIDILLSQELQDRKKFAYSKDLLSDAMNGKIFYTPLVGQSINTIYYPQIEHGTVATSYDPYREPQSLIFQTPNGLPGIPVSSGGIYTDSTGQQWVCDEIDLQRGVYVQRFKKVIIDQNTSLAADLGLYDTPEKITILFRHYDASIKKQGVILCRELLSSKDNWFVDAESANTTETGVDFRFTRERLGLGTETTPEENIIAVKKILETNPLHCLVELNVPIETPLSEDVIEAYKSLHTNYPTTVVTNDANVNMQLNYVADTKNFILNNIAQTNQAIVNTQAQLL